MRLWKLPTGKSQDSVQSTGGLEALSPLPALGESAHPDGADRWIGCISHVGTADCTGSCHRSHPSSMCPEPHQKTCKHSSAGMQAACLTMSPIAPGVACPLQEQVAHVHRSLLALKAARSVSATATVSTTLSFTPASQSCHECTGLVHSPRENPAALRGQDWSPWAFWSLSCISPLRWLR